MHNCQYSNVERSQIDRGESMLKRLLTLAENRIMYLMIFLIDLIGKVVSSVPEKERSEGHSQTFTTDIKSVYRL